ncbi:MAG: hypothetical protein V3U02_12525 [Calditrichia bacterium]
MVVTAAWPNPDRFKAHLEKQYILAKTQGKLPFGITDSIDRVISLFKNGLHNWSIKDTSAAHALHRLFFHDTLTISGLERKVRFQRNHTDTQLTNLLLSRCNIQPYNQYLDTYQINPIKIDEMCIESGFSHSTVSDYIRRFKSFDLLRTKRQKHPNDINKEVVAVRWLTPKFFKMLGMYSRIKKAMGKQVKNEMSNFAPSYNNITRQKYKNKNSPVAPQPPLRTNLKPATKDQLKEMSKQARRAMAILTGKNKPP